MAALPSWLSHWNVAQRVHEPIRVVGIDLGTTNSTVTEIVWSSEEDDPPTVTMLPVSQPTNEGGEFVENLIPSVVSFESGKQLVGRGAYRLRGTGPELHKNIWFDTKNEIGTSRVYPFAPEGYKNPTDIASRILSFLKGAIDDYDDMPVDRIVVSVPASFQLTQRQATLDAATAAEIELKSGNLIDEPVAALLDFLNSGQLALDDMTDSTRMMVVDFGGGTCDVALLQLRRSPEGGIQVSRRGVSRFTRLGGSDISRLIAHDVLLQALLEENGLSNKDLSFRQKEKILDRLTVTADQLKQALSEKVNTLRAGGAGLELLTLQEVRLPLNLLVDSGDPGIGELTLSQPSLTYAELTLGLSAFLNPHGFEPEYSEYYLATSIYAPIRDVLRRVEWTPEHIDRILVVGGSGLLLPVQHSLQDYFANAEIDTFADPADAQRCVSRGAAWHSFFLEAFGHSPIASTIGESLSVETAQGPQVIIEENTSLPFPAEGSPDRFYSFSGLTVPRGPSDGGIDLNITLKVGEQEVQSELISLTSPTQEGDPIDLHLRFDENQVLEGRIIVGVGENAKEYPFRVDNPLSVSINPNAKREQILDLERKMTALSAEKQVPVVEKIARLRSELGEYDQARGLFEKLAQRATRPEEKASHYERLADLVGKIGDDAGAEEYFRKATELGSTAAPFNFALWLEKDGRLDEALKEIDGTIQRGQGRVRHLLRSLILSKLQREEEAQTAYEKGRDELSPLSSTTDWELAWLKARASDHEDAETVKACQELLQSRKASKKLLSSGTLLPDYQS